MAARRLIHEGKEVNVTAALWKWNTAALDRRQQPSTVCNIVLPLDGNAASRAAIPVARSLAQLYRAAPHLVYVGEQHLDPKDIMTLLGVNTEQLPGAVLDACHGEVAEGIAGVARELPKSLIVLCTHTGQHVHPDCFGSVAEAVLGSGPERIVLVSPERGEKPWSLRQVLLAHDGTPASDAATAPAAELAMRGEAEVVALHVAARKAPTPELPGSLPAPRYIDQPQHEWPAWTSEFLDRMVALGAPSSAVHFNLVVAGGQPGSEIADTARERQADLVVMAWDGDWQRAKHMATRIVIRNSGCPVLLVRSAANEVQPV